MTTGENVPGDSEIVEMLIVHFQSSIKFNSHSASTCYSNSVTEYTSGTSSSLSLPPSFERVTTPPPPRPPSRTSSSSPSSLHRWPAERERERPCKYHRSVRVHVSRGRRTPDRLTVCHPFFSLPRSPRLALVPSLPLSPPLRPVSPLLISYCPNSSFSEFPLQPPPPLSLLCSLPKQHI